MGRLKGLLKDYCRSRQPGRQTPGRALAVQPFADLLVLRQLRRVVATQGTDAIGHPQILPAHAAQGPEAIVSHGLGDGRGGRPGARCFARHIVLHQLLRGDQSCPAPPVAGDRLQASFGLDDLAVDRRQIQHYQSDQHPGQTARAEGLAFQRIPECAS